MDRTDDRNKLTVKPGRARTRPHRTYPIAVVATAFVICICRLHVSTMHTQRRRVRDQNDTIPIRRRIIMPILTRAAYAMRRRTARNMIWQHCLSHCRSYRRLLDNSRIANSRTGQLAVSLMPPKERKLSTQSRRWHPRDVQSASWQSASCPVTVLYRHSRLYHQAIDSVLLSCS